MKATISPFRSNFYLWNGVSAIFFSNCVTNIHSHNTMQILVDIHDKFKYRIAGGPWLTGKNLILKEDIPHQLDTNNSVQLIIYLDTGTAAAKAIKTRYPGDATQPEFSLFHIISPNQLQQTLLKPDAHSLLTIVSCILQTLAGEVNDKKTDSRIQLLQRFITTSHPTDLTTNHLATQIHLSESRLRALFKDQTGVTLHKYILWTRIRYAINRIMTGSPINDAAWEAGFTDNSHFHKMLVSMFGISPSQFLRDNKKMEIFTCDSSPLNFETKVYDANGQLTAIHSAKTSPDLHAPPVPPAN